MYYKKIKLNLCQKIDILDTKKHTTTRAQKICS